MKRWLFSALLLCAACERLPESTCRDVEIAGRDAGDIATRQPLYRISLPNGWTAKLSSESVADTKRPLIECLYGEDEPCIRLTVHNFPYNTPLQRVPPEAQIARWKQQFDSIASSQTTPQAFAGFVGLHLFAEGQQSDREWAVSAWSMQLAAEHDRSLARKEAAGSQMRSDITIKAVGPKELIEEQNSTISDIARSFELLNPLPNP